MNTMTIDVAAYLTMKQDLDKLKKEKKELKKEKKELKETLDCISKRKIHQVAAENEQLRAELEELKKEHDELKSQDSHWERCYNEDADEKYFLREENEKLKEFAMNVHNFAYGTTYSEPEIMDSVEDFDGIVNQLKKDEDDFKDGITIIEFQNDMDRKSQAREFMDLLSEHEKLEKDNDKLEKEVSVLLAVASGDYNRADDFKALCKERFEEEFIDACDDDTLVGQYFTE